MLTPMQMYDLQTFGENGIRKTIVIADISSNHEKESDILESIDFLRSKNCFIKLQAYKRGQFTHLDNYVLPRELMKKIKAPDVFYSVFDTETVDWMEKEIDPPFYKLACRSYHDYELIYRVAQTRKPVIQSIQAGELRHNTFFKFLHCVPEYPAESAKLFYLKEWLDGYSDHTMNPIVPALAVAKGARIIEHHFAIRRMQTPDMCVSYTPDQWNEMLRNIEEAERHL